jgi:hypothetical protein
MNGALPPYVPRQLIAERLPLIFPEGIENRVYCTRELAASTVFAAIYIGAVEGLEGVLGPVHVYRMTVEQAAESSYALRRAYAENIRAKRHVAGQRWYADNTREPIRDETLRDGLVAVGAVIRREDLPTTSGAPRYILKADFAALFDPALADADLKSAIAAYQAKHLSAAALARVSIMLAGATASTSTVPVTFPNGLTRNLAPGPSSIISRAVVEVFAPRFLEQPAVLWLSESGNKVVVQDDKLAAKLGLNIEPGKNLPDLIIADVGGEHPLFVFVEVVATDGAMHQRRKAAMLALTDAAGFSRDHVAFLTAYAHREAAGYRKTVSQLAWGSLAWFAAEPDHLVIMWDGGEKPARLRSLLRR